VAEETNGQKFSSEEDAYNGLASSSSFSAASLMPNLIWSDHITPRGYVPKS
jgi:hypothetical protein